MKHRKIIHDEYTDDHLNNIQKHSISLYDPPVGISPTPKVIKLSRAKYRDANYMP